MKRVCFQARPAVIAVIQRGHNSMSWSFFQETSTIEDIPCTPLFNVMFGTFHHLNKRVSSNLLYGTPIFLSETFLNLLITKDIIDVLLAMNANFPCC